MQSKIIEQYYLTKKSPYAKFATDHEPPKPFKFYSQTTITMIQEQRFFTSVWNEAKELA